jgi:hypothetical protein
MEAANLPPLFPCAEKSRGEKPCRFLPEPLIQPPGPRSPGCAPGLKFLLRDLPLDAKETQQGIALQSPKHVRQ